MSEEICQHNRVKSQCPICNPEPPIAVRIDTSRIDKKLEELEQKLEGKGSKESVNLTKEHSEEEIERATEISDVLNKYGKNVDVSEVLENPLKYITMLKEEARKDKQAELTGRREGAGASGSVGLSRGQLTGKNEVGYESYGAMLRDLRKREREGDLEATKILEALYRKLGKFPSNVTPKDLEEYDIKRTKKDYKVEKKG